MIIPNCPARPRGRIGGCADILNHAPRLVKIDSGFYAGAIGKPPVISADCDG
ncbi:hypothetical protein X971_3742 [Agrobacterium tumefaciens LBA4213 (Ach5)]|nr:hypothetical protein X971_3742 [Agrobacterium tumefaciens LBA4213 (Ach5)]